MSRSQLSKSRVGIEKLVKLRDKTVKRIEKLQQELAMQNDFIAIAGQKYEEISKGETNAVYPEQGQGSISSGSSDRDAGESDVSDSTTPQTVLGE